MIIIKKYNLILKFSAINVVSADLIRVQSYYVLKKQLDMLIMFHSCVLIIVMQFSQSSWHSPLSSTRFCQCSRALYGSGHMWTPQNAQLCTLIVNLSNICHLKLGNKSGPG